MVVQFKALISLIWAIYICLCMVVQFKAQAQFLQLPQLAASIFDACYKNNEKMTQK
jgi:hypothetical protein